MRKSFRWKLLAWYALVVAGLAAAFGGLLYHNARRSIYGEADARLRDHATALAAALRPLEGGTFEVDLSPDLVRTFGGTLPTSPYYALWDAAGELIDRSNPAADVPRPPSPGTRDRGPFREVTLAGPGGALVLVGWDFQAERKRLRDVLAAAGGTGLVLVLLAAAGGWFLAGRALAPVAHISRAAAAVSASNLSERIDPARMEAELGELARTINGAFDRLQQALDRQARFTADASHELRTPLSIVLSHADHALARERDAGEYREALEAIRRAGRRMQAVVEGLLTLARADAGELKLADEPLDFRRLVEDVCAMLAPAAAERGLTLATDLHPARVRGDRDRLAEAVANLVTNAVRYNRDGGRIDVALRAGPDGQVVLTVADTGVGIPAADQPHVFERFYRADKARSRAAGGSGLGLAIARWVVEAHGGRIGFTSREGEGSSFTVRLNALRDAEATAPFPVSAHGRR